MFVKADEHASTSQDIVLTLFVTGAVTKNVDRIVSGLQMLFNLLRIETRAAADN